MPGEATKVDCWAWTGSAAIEVSARQKNRVMYFVPKVSKIFTPCHVLTASSVI